MHIRVADTLLPIFNNMSIHLCSCELGLKTPKDNLGLEIPPAL